MQGKGSAGQRWRVAIGLLLAVLFMSAAGPTVAKDKGRVEVRSAYTQLEDGVYYLVARLDFTLNKAALEALDNGVTLNFELQIELTQSRRYIWDTSVASLRQQYQIGFHALTQRYLVANLNSGERESFADLDSALVHLGLVEHLPVIDQALLDNDARYRVALRAILDVKELSGPLRWLSLVWGDWRIASEWYTWPMRE